MEKDDDDNDDDDDITSKHTLSLYINIDRFVFQHIYLQLCFCNIQRVNDFESHSIRVSRFKRNVIYEFQYSTNRAKNRTRT